MRDACHNARGRPSFAPARALAEGGRAQPADATPSLAPTVVAVAHGEGAASAGAARGGADLQVCVVCVRARGCVSAPACVCVSVSSQLWLLIEVLLGWSRLAWPSCLANLTFLSSMSVMAFVGQYGTDALAGAGLGFMWLNVSGMSIIFGTGMGLSALSSQAFGARNYRRVGLLVQRQLCYQMLLCVPISVCWWNTERILMLFGQPPSVARFSGMYCRHMLPGLPAIPIFNNLNVFLVSQRIPRPSMMVSLFSNICVAIPTASFLSQPDVLGFVGAPLGVACGQICQALLMRIVAPRMVKHPTWLPLQREALNPSGWIELLRLGVGAPH